MKVPGIPLWLVRGATMYECQIWKLCFGIRQLRFWRTSGPFWFMWDASDGDDE
jgi:hypothetical protein